MLQYRKDNIDDSSYAYRKTVTMSIQPEGENIRKAIKWIAEEEKAGSSKSRQQLIEAACLNFNLTPMEAEYLARSYKDISNSP